MRYIYYIIGVILLFSCAVLATGKLLTPATEEGDAVLTVNGRTITTSEISSRQHQSSYHFRSVNDFIDDLITRELLIQEARRRGIDREEPFRRAMQDQYEQSLIKLLMDRQLAELDVRVSPKDIARYRECSKYRYHMEQRLFDPGQDTSASPRSRVVSEQDFNDLPLPWQVQLLPIEDGGGDSSPFPLENQICVLHVDHISPAINADPDMKDDEIRQLLTDARRQLAFDNWLNKLRSEADIEKGKLLDSPGGQQ